MPPPDDADEECTCLIGYVQYAGYTYVKSQMKRNLPHLQQIKPASGPNETWSNATARVGNHAVLAMSACGFPINL